jgi:hypothetical protein
MPQNPSTGRSQQCSWTTNNLFVSRCHKFHSHSGHYLFSKMRLFLYSLRLFDTFHPYLTHISGRSKPNSHVSGSFPFRFVCMIMSDLVLVLNDPNMRQSGSIRTNVWLFAPWSLFHDVLFWTLWVCPVHQWLIHSAAGTRRGHKGHKTGRLSGITQA